MIAVLITALNTQAQVTAGLVAKYSFNSGNANDEAGTNNGTVNGATLTADRFGNANKAYSFNGSAYIDCGNGTAIQNLTTGYSISAWFKRSAIANQFEVIAAKWDNTIVSEHFFLATNGSNVAWAAPGPGNAGTSDPTTFTVNNWVHAVFTWTSTGVHQMYINNALTTNSTLTSHTVNVTTPVNFLIGAQSPTFRQFNGVIDDIRIYNRVLTPLEVATLFSEPNPTTVGLNENELKGNYVSVFPNPTTEIMNLSSSLKINTIEVHDLTGKILLSQENSNSINLNQLNSGMYFLKVYCENNQFISKKIVKQ